MHFATPMSSHLFLVSGVGILVGIAVFIVRAVWRDDSYEAFLPWSLRGLIYLLAYPIFPPAGLIAGVYLVRSKSRERRKFGFGSLYITTFYVLGYVAEILGAHLR